MAEEGCYSDLEADGQVEVCNDFVSLQQSFLSARITQAVANAELRTSELERGCLARRHAQEPICPAAHWHEATLKTARRVRYRRPNPVHYGYDSKTIKERKRPRNDLQSFLGTKHQESRVNMMGVAQR